MTSHGDRTRGLPGAQPDKATAGDVYRMAYRRIKKLWPNGIPNEMPNHLTGGLPNYYREANRYSTEAAYRVDRQSLPSRPRFTETPALLESASARRLSSGEKDQGEKIT